VLDIRPWSVKQLKPDWSGTPLAGRQDLFEALRDWQYEFISDGLVSLQRGHPYRRAAVVTLGGGKTLAGLCLCALGEVSVVAASTYLHETWRSEAAKWNLPCPILTTYESAHKVADPDVLIVDESLSCKDPETLRHQRLRKKAEKASIVVGFTGTPTGGKGPMDWRWLRVVEPGCVPATETAWRFLFGKDTKLVEVVPGRNAYVTSTWAVDQVAKFVEPYVYSADTSHLMSQLPEIQYTVIHCPQPRDWQMVAAGGATTATASKRVAQCRQIADGFVLNDQGQLLPVPHTPKLDAVCEWLETVGEPVVLYAAWTGTIDLLKERLKHYQPAVVRGDTSDPGVEIARFKNGATSLMIANSRMSSGMNLQSVCRIVAFLSPSLAPVDFRQACGRVYRPGQKFGVQIIKFVCEGTLDERTWELIEGHTALDEKQIASLLEESLREKLP
jgi:hypothetical protein